LSSLQAEEKREEADVKKLDKKKADTEKALRKTLETQEIDKKKQEHAQVLTTCTEPSSAVLCCVKKINNRHIHI
jgi:hypothetical protein